MAEAQKTLKDLDTVKDLTENSPKQREFTPREEAVGFLLWDARRALFREFSQKFAQHGVSNGVFPVLRSLWDEDELTQSEIARRGLMTGPTIVGIVAQLEAQKLVTRVPCPADSRKRKIKLTEEGVRLRAIVLPIAEDVHQKALNGITAEEADLLKKLLRRIRANFIGN
jgi:DNA-binding MarR family transcriptional regulator